MVLLLVVLFVAIFSVNQKNYEELTNFMQQYTRSMTILEISNSSEPYAYALARRFPHSVIVLLQTNKIKRNAIPANLIILQPETLPFAALQTLTRCEHFDVAIVHNMYEIFQSCNRESLLATCLKLADHCFVESTKRDDLLEKNPQAYKKDQLYFFETPKKGLDIARWNLRSMPPRDPYRYQVESNFNEKFLLKRNMKTGWVPGINLLTFVMLSGTYPSNNFIIEALGKYKHLQHNDLVVGNFVVQGAKLKPIDFNDAARRVPTKKSIKATIKLFKELPYAQNKSSLLNDYQERLQKILKK